MRFYALNVHIYCTRARDIPGERPGSLAHDLDRRTATAESIVDWKGCTGRNAQIARSGGYRRENSVHFALLL